jgi:hypothetical protein
MRTRDPLLSPPSTLLETFQCTCLQSNLQIFGKNLKIAPRLCIVKTQTQPSAQYNWSLRLDYILSPSFCPNVTFEDDEFTDNNALNDQGKDKGTIIVTAQLNLNMS